MDKEVITVEGNFFLSPASQELRNAYAKLPEEKKQELVEVTFKPLRLIWKTLWARAKLTNGGFRIDRLAQVYKTVAPRIDRVILNPETSSDALPILVHCYFQSIRKELMDRVTKSAHTAPTQKPLDGVEAELVRIKAEVPEDSLYPIFAALCRMLAETGTFDKKPAGEHNPAIVVSEPPSEMESNSPTTIATELGDLSGEAKNYLDRAAIAKVFDADKVSGVFSRMALLGEMLRIHLNSLRREGGASPQWETAGEFNELLKELDVVKKQNSENSAARSKLESVSLALGRVQKLDIAYRHRRDRLMELKKAAEAQLDVAAAEDIPPRLSGEGEGDDWLRQAYSLVDDGLEALIRELQAIDLSQLGAFVTETRFEELLFAPAGELVLPRPVPQVTTNPSEPAVKEAEVQEQFNTPQTTKSIETPAAARHEPCEQEIASQTPPPQSLPDAVTPPQAKEAPACEVAPAPVIEVGPAKDMEKVAPEPSPSTEGSPQSHKPGLKNGEPIERTVRSVTGPVVKEHVQDVPVAVGKSLDCTQGAGAGPAEADHYAILCSLQSRDCYCLMADYLPTLPSKAAELLPSVQIFEALSLQGGLHTPDGEVAEQTRILLRDLIAEPIPECSDTRLLLWSVSIIPVFVDSGSVGLAMLSPIPIPSLPRGLQEVTRSTIQLMQAIVNCHPSFFKEEPPIDAWNDELVALHLTVKTFARNAQTQTLNYQKASIVWHRLMARGGKLGELVELLLAPDGQFTPDAVRDLIARYQDANRFRRLIDQTTQELNPKRFEPIIASSYAQLTRKADELFSLGSRLVDHHARRPKQANFVMEKVADFKEKAIPALKDFLDSNPEVGTNNLSFLADRAARKAGARLLALFTDYEQWLGNGPALHDDAFLKRLCVPALPLDGLTHRPTGEKSEIHSALASAAADGLTTPADAIDQRSRAGDITNARQLLEILRNQRPAQDDLETIQETLDERARNRRNAAQRRLTEARALVVKARTLGVVPEVEAASKELALVRQEKQLQTTEDFFAITFEIGEIVAQLDERTRAESFKLSEEIVEARVSNKASKADEARLLSLVTKGDLATVREYLNRLQAGHKLPEPKFGERLGGFTLERQRELFTGFQSANFLNGLNQAIRTGGKFAQRSFEHFSSEEKKNLLVWLQAWQRVRQAAKPNETDVIQVLTGLGFDALECESAHQDQSGISQVRVSPTNDRDVCAIPQFGSASGGHIRILHVVGASPELILERSRKSKGPGFLCIFFGGVIEAEARCQIRKLCRDKQITLLVLDDLLVAHLAEVRGQRLTVFFKAATPYTWVDPFVSTSSLVPPEMFFGRKLALSSLPDTHQQRCFVYGGRQLGKTALLREVERRFNQPESHQFALWFDLLANGFGVEAEPQAIWGLLENKFRTLLGFNESWKASSKHKNQLEESVVHWLEADDRRRFLLLLDEGDRFLDRDSARDFAESRRLKGLMDRTNRRFKVVFAGLHNVQRTTTQSNHPLAHLGAPINIGAFSENGEWMEAYALLDVPFDAMGYEFESSDLPSRILTLCNFYPGLLQQFGTRLLQRTRSRYESGGTYKITADDIDAVARDEEFRKFMVERFKWTLQLDPRYHYLAYAYAYLFHENMQAAVGGFTATELRKYVEDYRPNEFSRLSQEEFRSLLDEMGGLGIFRKNDQGKYSLRNANVLLLLGDPSTILEELVSDRAIPKAEYQSESFHGILTGAKGEMLQRRVITRPDEARIVSRNGAVLVTGSTMLEVGLLERSVRTAFPSPSFKKLESRNLDKFSSDIDRFVEDRTDEHRVVFVGDHLPSGPDWFADAQQRCSGRKFGSVVSVVMLMPADAFWSPGFMSQLPANFVHIAIRKWGLDFIQPWAASANHPIPPDGPQNLLGISGGWPKLLYEFERILHECKDFSRAITEFSIQIESLVGTTEGCSEFLGEGVEAAKCFSLLKSFRSLSPAKLPSFSRVDLEDSADLLGVPPSELGELIVKAEMLQLVDRKGPEHFEWDPVFDRWLLKP